MIILFNKATNPKITDIKIYADPADMCYWTPAGGNFWSMDYENFKILCGGEGFVVTFEDAESMKPYIDQFLQWDSMVVDPAITPILTDLHQDKPSTGGIVPHTYYPTDIEKDLINNSRQ